MNEQYAQMAGTVLYVHVQPGDKIEQNQEIMTIESMKMEIPVASETAGEVLEVKVNVGDFINEGDALVVLK